MKTTTNELEKEQNSQGRDQMHIWEGMFTLTESPGFGRITIELHLTGKVSLIIF